MPSQSDHGLWDITLEQAVRTSKLQSDSQADLIIIGGGFTGTSAALEAARSGAKVILLEARTIGHGGSGRNVGLVNAGLWLPPDKIVEELGPADGERLIGILGEGPSEVFRIIERETISCEAIRSGTLHLAHAKAGLDDLQARHRQGNRFGAPLRLLDGKETADRTGSPAFHGALFDPRAGTIQPLAYCHGLAMAAQNHGARLYEETPVQRMDYQNDRWVIEANGNKVTAPTLLMATNAYHEIIQGCLKPQFVTVSYSQFATEPLPEDLRGTVLAKREGCWDTALVMSSIRTDQSGRLIIGGMGDARGAGSKFHRAWAERKLKRIFPHLPKLAIEHMWSGKIAMTVDHIPKIASPGPSALAVFGYSGRGIAPGTVFGKRAAKALLTGDHDCLPLQPQNNHQERLANIRRIYFEFGATVAHTLSAR